MFLIETHNLTLDFILSFSLRKIFWIRNILGTIQDLEFFFVKSRSGVCDFSMFLSLMIFCITQKLFCGFTDLMALKH